jgi:iron(II)-dependent oxidoreductase
VEEMSGNVWEWTRSIFGSYPDVPGGDREEVVAGPSEVRVLRGGAFHANPRNVRCAYRHKVGPENQDNDVGFRVVVLRARPVA